MALEQVADRLESQQGSPPSLEELARHTGLVRACRGVPLGWNERALRAPACALPLTPAPLAARRRATR
jgi:hypothetical protein